MFLLGGVFSAQFGMSSVYGAIIGLSVGQISTFVAMFFVGAMVLQYPIGWLSDRFDRRALVVATAAIGVLGAFIGYFSDGSFNMILASAFVMGGVSNPLYSLLLAHTNDYLESEDMAAASGGLIFINGLGAISGPLITGWMMGQFGPSGFYLFIIVLNIILVIYATYRATQRASIAVEDTGSYVYMTQSGTPVVMEIAQEYVIEADDDSDGDGQTATPAA
jgi:MFS family permease